jgi:hypothetical protein
MFLCTFLAFAGAAVFTLAKAHWQEMDAQDPGKIFAQEVFQTVKARIPWAHTNGVSPNGPGASLDVGAANQAEASFLQDCDSREEGK